MLGVGDRKWCSEIRGVSTARLHLCSSRQCSFHSLLTVDAATTSVILFHGGVPTRLNFADEFRFWNTIGSSQGVWENPNNTTDPDQELDAHRRRSPCICWTAEWRSRALVVREREETKAQENFFTCTQGGAVAGAGGLKGRKKAKRHESTDASRRRSRDSVFRHRSESFLVTTRIRGKSAEACALRPRLSECVMGVSRPCRIYLGR